MKFGPVPVAEAEGAILAHSVRHRGGMMRKGTILSAERLTELGDAGVDEVIVARLGPDDVHEDTAAEALAGAIAGSGLRVDPPFTGRSNLYAETAGLLVVDRAAIDRINRIDPAITVATLDEYSVVDPGRMAATVKIIPFAAPRAQLEQALAVAADAVRVAPFRARKVGLVATTLPSLKPSVMDKTRRLLEERLAVAGATLTHERRVPHEADAVAAALNDMMAEGIELAVVFGASATVDAEDVVPAGIVTAGGRVVHFGMPVDPGNLLVLAELGDVPVIGAPGCARSPRENGFDWVLNRLLADLPVTPKSLTGLGVGGLLMEIVSRPQPRGGEAPMAGTGDETKVAAIVLAAGRSRRMGGPNKLVATVGGRPLVRIATEAALASRADTVVVVTGHRADEVETALAGLDVQLVHNPDYAEGLSTSLKQGIEALAPDIDGAVILLADMPGVDAQTIDRLIESFDPDGGGLIVLPTFEGKRGNPVLWSKRLFPDLLAVEGDTGGRHLIGAYREAVVEVETGRAVAVDVDTPEALAAIGGKPA
ncbi:MAG: molybdopterin-binding/glycosyltransferase family 2 protein [Bauldia sp.]|nr:molybdopterin-binding/glycosyltransferase family 2 protein [Bauldia sp.]